jgi:hypothetical protein
LGGSVIFVDAKIFLMNEEFLYRKIQEALKNIPENFNILEEQIDVQLQMTYFEFSRKLREEEDLGALIDNKDTLFDPLVLAGNKKKILVALASSAEVEAFRTIERFLKNPDTGLKDWAILALQESRMLLQSSLLDEQQVFISTGLGGKGRSLRYFVVFLNKEGAGLTKMQQKLLRDELSYTIEKNEGELEEFDVMLDFTTAMVILPLKAQLKDIFRAIIDECNQYGDFLDEDMVITNVKKLNTTEIVEILQQQRAKPEDTLSEEDEG